jgi:uncharacterized RDD family membrane protein YckC
MNSIENPEKWISGLNTEDLKKIVEVDFNQYEEYVLYVAKEELVKREVSGFAQEDIQNKDIDMGKLPDSGTVSTDCGLQNIYKDISTDRTFERIGDIKQEFVRQVIDEKHFYNEDEQYGVRPWVRFWARAIDLFVFGSIIVWVIASAFPWYYVTYGNQYIVSIVVYLIWVFFEALLISKWGCTLGKWLLNTRVQNADGSNLSYSKALKRAFLIFFFGEGLRIPIINLVMNIISYKRLVEQGVTKWDEQEEVFVSHKQLDAPKIVFAIILFVFLQVAIYCVSEILTNYR